MKSIKELMKAITKSMKNCEKHSKLMKIIGKQIKTNKNLRQVMNIIRIHCKEKKTNNKSKTNVAKLLKASAACVDFGARMSQGFRRRHTSKWALSHDLESSKASQGVSQGAGARSRRMVGAMLSRRV